MKTTARRLLVTAAILGTTPALLAGCGTKTVSGKTLAQQIQKGLETKAGKGITVSCPGSIEVKAGATARCTAKDPKGNQLPLRVTMKDDKGNFSYAPERGAKR